MNRPPLRLARPGQLPAPATSDDASGTVYANGKAYPPGTVVAENTLNTTTVIVAAPDRRRLAGDDVEQQPAARHALVGRRHLRGKRRRVDGASQ